MLIGVGGFALCQKSSTNSLVHVELEVVLLSPTGEALYHLSVLLHLVLTNVAHDGGIE